MKKLLLASTALVMSAGVAAADVTVGGDGRMGLIYNGDDVQFTSRVRVSFTLSGETDAGMAFGGSIRADNAPGGTRGTAGNVFVSGDFGKLSMGDVDGAALKAVGDLFFGSLTGLGDRQEMAYLSRSVSDDASTINVLIDDTILGILGTSNRPRALYEYSFDGFGIFVSIDNPAVQRDADGNREISLRNVAIGASYTFDGFTGGIGYEDLRFKFEGDDDISAKHLIASAMYEFDGFAVKAIAGRVGGDVGTLLNDTPGASRDQYGLSVRGTFDEVTVTAFANRNFFTTDYGIGAAYDLGGGAALTGGIVRRGSSSNNLVNLNGDDVSFGSRTQADFGLTFRF